LGENLSVQLSGCIIVVPEANLDSPRQSASERGRLPCYLVADTHVVDFLLEQSLNTTSRSLVGDDMFPVRERLQAGIRFV
jgi:hypothetical protein